MPWITIIVWVLTYLLSSQKEGTSKGKAALLATGAAVGTYVLADPANEHNLLGVGQSGSTVSDTDAGSITGANTSGGSNVLPVAGSVLKAAVASPAASILAGGHVANNTSTDTIKKWAPWVLGGLAIFLLAK